MLAVLTCFAFFVKRTLADPIQRYGDAVVRRRGRRLREDAAIGIRQTPELFGLSRHSPDGRGRAELDSGLV